MKDAIIEIQCRFCRTILRGKNCTGIEDMFVTCPTCEKSYPFRIYLRRDIYFDCNVSPIDSIMYHSYKDNEIWRQNQYRTESPYSITLITLNEDNEFYIKSNDRKLPSSIKNTKLAKSQIDDIRCHIKELDNNWELHETYYLCPACGNVMIVTSPPIGYGDDIGCECPCCGNRIYFGGTRGLYDEVMRINEFSANPMILARNVYKSKTEMIAQMLHSEIFLIDGYSLIVKASANGWKVSHILKLNVS